MADEIRTDTPGLARRIAQFEVEDTGVVLRYDPRLCFYIPKRWWVAERFDINVHASAPGWERTGIMLPHLEVDVSKRSITLYRPTREVGRTGLALLTECLAFAGEVLAEV